MQPLLYSARNNGTGDSGVTGSGFDGGGGGNSMITAFYQMFVTPITADHFAISQHHQHFMSQNASSTSSPTHTHSFPSQVHHQPNLNHDSSPPLQIFNVSQVSAYPQQHQHISPQYLNQPFHGRNQHDKIFPQQQIQHYNPNFQQQLEYHQYFQSPLSYQHYNQEQIHGRQTHTVTSKPVGPIHLTPPTHIHSALTGSSCSPLQHQNSLSPHLNHSPLHSPSHSPSHSIIHTHNHLPIKLYSSSSANHDSYSPNIFQYHCPSNHPNPSTPSPPASHSSGHAQYSDQTHSPNHSNCPSSPHHLRNPLARQPSPSSCNSFRNPPHSHSPPLASHLTQTKRQPHHHHHHHNRQGQNLQGSTNSRMSFTRPAVKPPPLVLARQRLSSNELPDVLTPEPPTLAAMPHNLIVHLK